MGYRGVSIFPIFSITRYWRTTNQRVTNDLLLPEGMSPEPLYDTNMNGRITCSEARAHGIAPVSSTHPAYEHMNDGDGDGKVCE